MSFDVEEEKLCEKLKKTCYVNGREKDPERAAFILNALGENQRRSYFQSFNKLALLKSAILLNAAIKREPDNVDTIKLNRRKLYEDVLKCAGIEDILADDLISQASSFFTRVEHLRKNVDEKLNRVNKISTRSFGKNLLNKEKGKIREMKKIQNMIFNHYTKLMRDIMCYCIDVKGSAPCKYVLVGMGSLARKEITPYSDFESVIILKEGVQLRRDYNDILEYFRWIAVLFQIILISFGETIVPVAGLPHLSWFYDVQTRGISPDAYFAHASKNPLGRQEWTEKKPWTTELIKPVSKMLEYLESETDLKNGYHLANVLTKTCFVAGNKEVYKKFENGIKEKQANSFLDKNFLHLIEEDTYRFNISKILQNLVDNDSINLKQTVYRAVSLFVAAMGQLHSINSLCPFTIIEKLAEKRVVKKEEAHKFRYAIALACQMRLEAYTFAQSQHDEVTEYFSCITELVGIRSSCDFFFIVGYLQQMLLDTVDSITEDNLSDVSSSSSSSSENEDMSCSSTNSESSNDAQSSEDDNIYFLWFPPGCLTWLNHNVKEIIKIGGANVVIFMMYRFLIHISLHQYDELLNYCDSFIQLVQDTTFPSNLNHFKDLSIFCDATKLQCHFNLENHEKVEENFLSSSVKDDQHFYYYGLSLLAREKWSKAVMMLARAINGSTEDVYQAGCHDGLGDCMDNLRKHGMAMYHWQKAAQLYQKLDDKTNKALVLIKIGKYHMSKNTDQTALQKLKEALLLQQQATFDESCDETIADTMEEVAKCLKIMQRHDEAKYYLEQSSEIWKKVAVNYVLDATQDSGEERNKVEIEKMDKMFDKRKVDLRDIFEYTLKEEDQEENGLDFLMCKANVVHYHVLLNCKTLIWESWESCVNRFEQQLAECEWLPVIKAEACNKVGNCYAELNDPCKAVQWFENATKYYTGDDASLADCLINITKHLRENDRSHEAKSWGCKAVDTLQHLSNCEQDAEAKADLYKKVAEELFHLKRFEEAKGEYEKAVEQFKLSQLQWREEFESRSLIPLFDSSSKYEKIIITSIACDIVCCYKKIEKCSAEE